jgi:hypothetical protein
VTLRVWSEFLTPAELRDPAVGSLLARFGCGVLVQTRRERLDNELAASLAVLAEAGVPNVGLWLLLDEDAGYWPSERNAAAVLELTREVVARRLPVGWLAIDLEPPLQQARQPRPRTALANLNPRRFAAAAATFRQVIDAAHAGGLRVLCAAHDYLAEDLWLGRPVLQDRHEAPVLGLPWDTISVMLYGSMMSGDARGWMYDTAQELAPLNVGASIGLTAAGILGDEPHYDSPAELAADAAALKAAGVRDFAVYSLEGILASQHPEAWLRAVLDAEPQAPPRSGRVVRERLRRRAAAVLLAALRRLR